MPRHPNGRPSGTIRLFAHFSMTVCASALGRTLKAREAHPHPGQGHALPLLVLPDPVALSGVGGLPPPSGRDQQPPGRAGPRRRLHDRGQRREPRGQQLDQHPGLHERPHPDPHPARRSAHGGELLGGQARGRSRLLRARLSRRGRARAFHCARRTRRSSRETDPASIREPTR